MLPFENRLIKKKDIKDVYKWGDFFSFNIVSLKTKKNNLKKTRIGFSIGKPFSLKATERNRVKRQIREIIRKNIEKIKKGFDVIIFINSKNKNISSEEIQGKLEKAFKKAKLID